MTPGSSDDSSMIETGFPRRLGPYVLAAYLDEGGMGRVYLALRNVDDADQICVIKRFGNPRASFTAEQILENRERFRREAEITMALDHPCIARTFSSEHEGSQSYLVQEYVKGMTLQSLTSGLTSGKEHYSIPLAAHIVAQIAGALAYVHDFRSLGLVHRDLTPTNVMFAESGVVKVIDFGIAKATLTDDSLTQPHIVVGKPLWTAPEVVTGDKPDRRADLYALGLLFWHLLTGNNPTSYLAKVIAPLPPPSEVNPEVPAQLDKIVAKAIHADPNRRFQTATEFLDVVTPLIPEGYQGSKELAHQIFRYHSALADEAFAEDIARARPLLEQAEPPRSMRKMVLVLTLSAAAAIALGIPLVHRLQVHRALPPAPAQTPAAIAVPQPTVPPVPPPGPPPQQPLAPRPTSAPPLPAALAPSLFPNPAAPAGHRARKNTTPNEHANTEVADQVSSTPSPEGATAEEILASAREHFDHSEDAIALRLAKLAAKRGAGAAAYVLIGSCLSLKKDYAGARAALEQALRLSPENADAKYFLEKLRRDTQMTGDDQR